MVVVGVEGEELAALANRTLRSTFPVEVDMEAEPSFMAFSGFITGMVLRLIRDGGGALPDVIMDVGKSGVDTEDASNPKDPTAVFSNGDF